MADVKAPLISVIIPSYNEAITLPLQLEALISQIDPPPFEVIVVDNNSTDETSIVASKYKDRLNLRIVHASFAAGASYARNVGVSVARTGLLMFCDADDVVSQWWLSQGLKTFSVAELWTGSAIPVFEDVFSEDVDRIRRLIGDDSVWLPPVRQETHFPILMGGNFGITKDVFFQVGGFDQSFATVGDDNDFGFRANALGYEVPISPTVRLAYRTRVDPVARRHLVFKAAQAHVLLATRYNKWNFSHRRRWPGSTVRTLIAAARMTFDSKKRNWGAVGERLATNFGVISGVIRYRWLRRLPPNEIGIGLAVNSSTTKSQEA